MSTDPEQSPQGQVHATRGMAAKTVEMIQGAYYVIGGLVVALFIASIQGPADHPRPANELWLVRIVALVVAGLGVALFISGWRTGRPFMPAGLGMWVALALFAQDAAGMAMGVLPLTFLAGYALLFGLALTLIAGAFGVGTEAPFLDRVLAMALISGGVAASSAALVALIGPAGSAVAAVLDVSLGAQISGAGTAREFMPTFWGDFGHYLPGGAGTSLLRDVFYFPQASTAEPISSAYARSPIPY